MAGILLALVGVAVLVIAIVALHDPRSDGSQDAGSSVGVSDTPAPPTSASPSPSRTSPAPSSSSSGPTTAPPVNLGGSSSPSSSATDPKAVPLVVLNNTEVTGLAGSAARRFEDGGWTVTSSGNLQNEIVSTCAYYDPAVTGAKAAAQALRAQFPTIKRVQVKFAGLPSGPVVVVLTPDYSSG